MPESTRLFHTNLFSPLQALPTMKLLYLQLNGAFKSETSFLSMCADVKEMYDWLPQHHIIKAIEWVLKTIEKRSRRSHVTVFFRETKQNRIGKSYNLDESISISFKLIFEVSKFQIKSAFFCSEWHHLSPTSWTTTRRAWFSWILHDHLHLLRISIQM